MENCNNVKESLRVALCSLCEVEVPCKCIGQRIRDLENKIKKFENDFEQKLDVDYKKWIAYYNVVHPKKSPHKCPVCDGLGKTDVLLPDACCNACKGKGVVWG